MKEPHGFVGDALPRVHELATKYGPDLKESLRGQPVAWPIVDRLLAKHCPEHRAAIVAYHSGRSGSLAETHSARAIVLTESRLSEGVLNELARIWLSRFRPARRVRSDTASPDLVATEAHGTVVVAIAPDAVGRWSSRQERLILDAARALFILQRDFLQIGHEAIRPLALTDVARALGIHASTVGRRLSGLTAATPHGLVWIRDLFSSAVPHGAGIISARSVEQKIAALIGTEDGRPLTDAAIQERLSAEGIRVARRTVAKYRQQLGVQRTHQRRSSDARKNGLERAP